ncbi:hypothetical protein CFP75_34370 [Amycolatopsis alba DSM 44262]|uniref:Uncharacterized protein n=1 Tax=Amycolatopsis alba DSM 44262 TaxID=1125972 RepID=A0A229RDJ7_AMYAL|nr:hypothetical protein CFP75_34370 [Amycolatopsis alba DSM 44262]
MYPIAPGWYPLAVSRTICLVVFTGEAACQRHDVALGENGRYPLGELGRWFLSGPTRTRERFHRQLDVLRDAKRHYPRPGEIVVTCDPDNLPVSGFPARIDTSPGARALVFRPEIAEAVAVWCATSHDLAPGDHPLVYFDGDTLVDVHQHRRIDDGYLPLRIAPDQDGN